MKLKLNGEVLYFDDWKLIEDRWQRKAINPPGLEKNVHIDVYVSNGSSYISAYFIGMKLTPLYSLYRRFHPNSFSSAKAENYGPDLGLDFDQAKQHIDNFLKQVNNLSIFL